MARPRRRPAPAALLWSLSLARTASRVEAVVVTHFHDDHVAGLNLIRDVKGTEIWAPEHIAPVLEDPKRFDLPCLWSGADSGRPRTAARDAGPVARVRAHASIRCPGHTLFACAIAFEVDGRRVLAIGDQHSTTTSDPELPVPQPLRAARFRRSARAAARAAAGPADRRALLPARGHGRIPRPARRRGAPRRGAARRAASRGGLRRARLRRSDRAVPLDCRGRRRRSSSTWRFAIRSTRGETAKVRLVAAGRLERDAGGARGRRSTRTASAVVTFEVVARRRVRPHRRGPHGRRDAVRPAGRGARVRPLTFANDAYRLDFAANGRYAALASTDGRLLLSLPLLAARRHRRRRRRDARRARRPSERGDTFVVERRSTLWERAWLELRCLDTCVEVQAFVQGRGAVTDVRLLGGRSLVRGAPLGRVSSGTRLADALHAESGGRRRARPAARRGHRHRRRRRRRARPRPLALHAGAALRRARRRHDVDRPRRRGPGRRAALRRARARGDGERVLAQARLRRAHATSTASSRRRRSSSRRTCPIRTRGSAATGDDLAARGAAPEPRPRDSPAWWREPIFCGWGAQCQLERVDGGLARDYATQERLRRASSRTSRSTASCPGTIVLDDKWQATYGGNEPDAAKWPDLRGWIAERHARGQHVLLWWKAWDPEGLPTELCVRNPDGVPGRARPGNDAARARAARDRRRGCSAPTASTRTASRSTSPRGRRAAARSARPADAGGSPCCTSSCRSSTRPRRRRSRTRS